MHDDFLVKSLPFVALPLHTCMQVGGLLGKDVQLLLLLANVGVESVDALAQTAQI